MIYEIYLHKNKTNNKVYIGLTHLTLMKRWASHINKAKYTCKKNNGNYFHRAIIKYGVDNWEHILLEICDSLEGANIAERKWIKHLKSNMQEFGYNLTPGGDHLGDILDIRIRRKLSYKIKKIMRDPVRRERQRNISLEWLSINPNPFLGKKHSEENKLKISKGIREWHNFNPNPFLNKKHSEEAKIIMRKKAAERCAQPDWKPPLKGKKHSEATKLKMVEACKYKIYAPPIISKSELLDLFKKIGAQNKVAEYIGCTSANISFLTKKYNIRNEIKKIIAEFNNVLEINISNIIITAQKCQTKTELAKNFGVTISAISRRLIKLGIKDQVENYLKNNKKKYE